MTPKASVLAPEVETQQQQGGTEIAISLLEALFGDRAELCVWVVSKSKGIGCDEEATHAVSCPACRLRLPVCTPHLVSFLDPRRPYLVRCKRCGHIDPRESFPVTPIGGSK